MSPPRRRSARLASGPKRSRTSPSPQLASLTERDESPEEQPAQSLDAIMSSPMPQPRTPAAATPVKLPKSEMHPSKFHTTMAPPSSGLKLGFTDIKKSKDQTSDVAQTTPSKTPVPSSAFTFRHSRPDSDTELGPEAKKLMAELRGEAAKIKVDLAAQREKEREEESANDGRKIAKAKGKAGRYSAVHMAEFKKMDSIEGHPSSFRATPGRFMPMNTGIKRTQSKANLDEPESVRSKTTSTRSVLRSHEKQREEPESPTKRVRQRIEDDASSLRPVSRDGTSIPRPKSSGNDSIRSGIPRSQTHNNLMTPTKSSLARKNIAQTPTISLVKSSSKPNFGGLVRSPSKPEFGGLASSSSKPDLSALTRTPSKKGWGGLKKSVTMNSLPSAEGAPTHVQTPGRFDRVKSILKRQLSGTKPRSNIPSYAASSSKTPGKQGANDKALPPIPLTTPGRKLDRHVNFTPETKRATMTQNSPSPTKSGIPRSKTTPKLPSGIENPFSKPASGESPGGEVVYPDLSAYQQEGDEEAVDEVVEAKPDSPPQSVPGTFTFRSDHTIHFDSISPEGFGGASGQTSIRQVRDTAIPSLRMPGSFPRPTEGSPNKENKDPVMRFGIPHGMSNKKRHRASWNEEDEVFPGFPHGVSNKKRHRASWNEEDDVMPGFPHGVSNKKRHRATWDGEEEDDEGAKRGAKKSRKETATAEGHALVAPRLASPAKKPAGLSRTPSPQKKGGLSLSRLNMLARPKVRK